jgi:RNA-binding protein
VSNTTAKAAKAKTPAAPKELTGKERRTLRALGHSLSPVVRIGKAGLTKGVTLELQGALEAHELIKVQLLGECPLERSEAADRVSAATSASVVQTLGKVLLFYKPNLEKPKVSLEHPAASGDAPRRKANVAQKREPVRSHAPRRSPRTSASRKPAAGGRRRTPNG